MAQGVNAMTADGVTKAVNGLMSMITLSLTGVEEILVFVIGMMTNTYLCLITLAVSGSLQYGISLLSNAQNDLNTMLKSIGNDISSASTTLQNDLNGLVSGINTFTGSSIPKVDFSKEIDELNNVTLPASLNDDLQKLNNSIPTFADVKNATQTLIRLPFEDLKTLINTQMGNYSFNDSLFPVPDKTSLTFCSDNNDINDFFDGLVKVVAIAKIVFIVVLLIAAVLCCIPMAWWEIRRWASLQLRAKLIRKQALDPMDAVYMASRPWTSRIGMMISNRFSSPRRQIIVRWAVAYATSLPALLLLSLALAGLFSCLCQFILVKAIQREVPVITQEIANFTDKVVSELNNASATWATTANAVIQNEGQKINTDLLGWVNTSTTAVNNTLNAFVDDTINVLNTTFGGTPLYGPITGVFNCLVELKVQSIQDGLAWVHDNAHISFPTLPNDTFTLGAVAKTTGNNGIGDFLTDPSSTTSDDISAAVNKVTDIILKAIKQEAILAFMLLVAWVIIAIIGLVRASTLFGGRDKVRAEAGNEYDAPSAPSGQDIRPVTPRPASSAPPYTYVNPDVNRYAPYALNPHPFPQRPTSEEYSEKRASSTAWPFSSNHRQASPGQDPFADPRNEKPGFI
jgi:hypothetical protein